MKKIIILALLATTVAVGIRLYYGEGKCTGSSSCSACKNCKYCKHCAKNGGTCGVCK